MARIQIEFGTRRAQVVLTGALSIGRDANCRIVIPDPEVAPAHARIRPGEGGFIVENSGDAKTYINGTLLNGSPHRLQDGDQLRIGSALITFTQDATEAPAPMHPAGRTAVATTAAQDVATQEPTLTDPARISFSCECGAVFRVRAEYAGRTVQCKRCQRRAAIPSLSKKTVTLKRQLPHRPLDSQPGPTVQPAQPSVASGEPAFAPAPQAAPAMRTNTPTSQTQPVTPATSGPQTHRSAQTVAMCGVCQCAIEETDLQSACPQCRLPYHAECWTENLGCAAYGCSQVNALKQGPDIRITNPPPVTGYAARRPAATAQTEGAIPWDFLLLSASAIGFLLSMVTCGLASLALGLTAFASMVYSSNSGKGTRATTIIAFIISCLGFLIGGVVSLILYFG